MGGKKGKKQRPLPRKNVVLFVPKPEDQERRRPRLDTTKRVLAWPCAGRTASRSAATPIRLAPPLRVSWKKKLRAPAATAPVVSEDGVLYVADRDGELRALDAETGEEHLRFHTDPILGASPAWPLVASGVVPGDRVPVSSPPVVSDWHLLFGDDEGIFYCVRRGDFEAIWRKAAPLSLAARRGGAYLAPVCASGTVFTVDADGNLRACSAQNGQTIFNRYLRGAPTAPPVVTRGLVLVPVKPLYPGEPARLHAIDAVSGERRWTQDLRLAPGRALAATHDRVFVGGEEGATVLAVESGSRLRELAAPVTGPVALDVERRRIFAPLAGALAALDLESGETAWHEDASVQRGTGVALAGSVVWAAGDKGLVALDAATGEPRGKVPVKGGVVGGPVLAAGRLFLALDTGSVLAYEA
jgi:outer membrane protein assembly factor BamB